MLKLNKEFLKSPFEVWDAGQIFLIVFLLLLKGVYYA